MMKRKTTLLGTVILLVLSLLYGLLKQAAPEQAEPERSGPKPSGSEPSKPVETRQGRVVYVYDGDTLKIKGLRPRIRLWGVDAAEKGEKGAETAKQSLRRMVQGKTVSYTERDRDRYGRLVARVFLDDGREVNKMLIEQGVAREYCHYSKGFYGHCMRR